MATNQTMVELVTFKADGLDTITERTFQFALEVERAQKRVEHLAESLNSKFHVKFAEDIRQANREYQILASQGKLQAAASDLGNAEAQRREDRIRQLSRQMDVLSMKTRNVQLSRDLKSGALATHAREVGAATKEQEKLNKAAEQYMLMGRYGVVGGFMRANRNELLTLLGIGGAGVAMGAGVVRSGFSNTAEWARMELAMEKFSRAAAAIFIPVVNSITYTFERLNTILRSLNREQQDALMTYGVVAAGAVAAAGALMTVATALKAIVGIATGLRIAASFLGVGGVGAAGASAAAAGAGSAAGAAAAGGGAAAARGGAAAAGASFATRAVSRVALPIAVLASAYELYTDAEDRGGKTRDYIGSAQRMQMTGTTGGSFDPMRYIHRQLFGGSNEMQQRAADMAYDATLRALTGDRRAPNGSVPNERTSAAAAMGGFGAYAPAADAAKKNDRRDVTYIPRDESELGGGAAELQRAVTKYTMGAPAAEEAPPKWLQQILQNLDEFLKRENKKTDPVTYMTS